MDVLEAVDRCFAPDYAESRTRFRAAASAAGATVRTYANPNKGPSGEDLGADVAWSGPSDARKVYVTLSATHGAEGFCGAGAQIDWLANGGPGRLPAGAAALLVHAINPHGFAWLRRVTEEGCDLNRNYLDFSQPLPANPGHDELVDHLVPAALDAGTLARAAEAIRAFRQTHGEKAFQTARKAGQYRHPHSMFFGGFGPTWAHATLAQIIADYELADRSLVAVVDYHTGLGPYGYGEPICAHLPDSVGMTRVMAMYGESVGVPELGTSSSIPLHGTSRELWNRLLGDTYTYVALEFGTYSPEQGLHALREDHWLHNQGPVDWAAPETRRIKAQIRRQYHPDTADWKEMVLWRSRQIERQSLAGLETYG